MLAALTLALSLQPSLPPVTHHFVLHAGGHAIVHAPKSLRSWTNTRSNVATLGDIHRMKSMTTMRITATEPGATAITVGCDNGGLEVWLVDVR